MKKLVLIVVAIVAFNHSLSAQEERVTGKAFYAELGGPGVYMSMNFDSRFKSNERLGLGFRLGAGFGVRDVETRFSLGGAVYSATRTYYSIPAGLNYVFGKPNSAHTFEIGAGLTLLTRKVALYYWGVREWGNTGNVIGFFTFMYRLMPVNGGFSFRVGLTPIIGTGGDLLPSGAIGFGYAF